MTVRGPTRAFGSTRALDGVDLTVKAGEVHALLGANGAGKSTLLAIVAGIESADTGDLEVAAGGSRDRPSVAIVYQELSLLPHLSVLENIATHELLLAGRARGRRRRARAAARAALASPGQDTVIDLAARVGDLPLDRQQMVEIARGLAQGAQLLLLDEPTASLNRPQVERLFTVLRGLTADGVGVVLVSHRFREIREVADVATVLRDGRTVADRVPLTDIDDQALLTTMVGDAARALDRPTPVADAVTGEPPLLELPDTEAPLRVGPGEVVGITSLDPSAASDLLLRAWGDRSHPPGQTMRVLGRSTARWSPRRAVRAGVGYVSGNRARDGVWGNLSVLEHLVLRRRRAETVARVARPGRRLYASPARPRSALRRYGRSQHGSRARRRSGPCRGSGRWRRVHRRARQTRPTPHHRRPLPVPPAEDFQVVRRTGQGGRLVARGPVAGPPSRKEPRATRVDDADLRRMG
ncbi:ATP-binding cassette domain-containing protein [Streptomyces sp. NPDC021098]|uniref:ATP-binding cassette domain-containing protein n=1 Tax=unclassified Streptomyces TaxID=2593676 RepID=UPI00379245AD